MEVLVKVACALVYFISHLFLSKIMGFEKTEENDVVSRRLCFKLLFLNKCDLKSE